MRLQRLLVALTVVNFVLLMFSWAQPRPVASQVGATVLRDRALDELSPMKRSSEGPNDN